MKSAERFIGFTVAYWICTLLILFGFVIVLGDCMGDGQCVEDHHRSFVIALAVAISAYIVLLIARRPSKTRDER